MEQVIICADDTGFQFPAHLGQSQGMRAIRLFWPSATQGHENSRGVETEFEDAKIFREHTAVIEGSDAQMSNDGEIAALPGSANALSVDEAAGDDALQPPVERLSEAGRSSIVRRKPLQSRSQTRQIISGLRCLV